MSSSTRSKPTGRFHVAPEQAALRAQPTHPDAARGKFGLNSRGATEMDMETIGGGEEGPGAREVRMVKMSGRKGGAPSSTAAGLSPSPVPPSALADPEGVDDDMMDEEADSDDEDGDGSPPVANKSGTTTTTTGARKPRFPNKRNAQSVGRRKIHIEFIEDKPRRHVTFTKRKSGLMKKAYELSTLTGTDCLVVVVSESGLLYTFSTPALSGVTDHPRGREFLEAALRGDIRGDGTGDFDFLGAGEGAGGGAGQRASKRRRGGGVAGGGGSAGVTPVADEEDAAHDHHEGGISVNAGLGSSAGLHHHHQSFGGGGGGGNEEFQLDPALQGLDLPVPPLEGYPRHQQQQQQQQLYDFLNFGSTSPQTEQHQQHQHQQQHPQQQSQAYSFSNSFFSPPLPPPLPPPAANSSAFLPPPPTISAPLDLSHAHPHPHSQMAPPSVTSTSSASASTSLLFEHGGSLGSFSLPPGSAPTQAFAPSTSTTIPVPVSVASRDTSAGGILRAHEEATRSYRAALSAAEAYQTSNADSNSTSAGNVELDEARRGREKTFPRFDQLDMRELLAGANAEAGVGGGSKRARMGAGVDLSREADEMGWITTTAAAPATAAAARRTSHARGVGDDGGAGEGQGTVEGNEGVGEEKEEEEGEEEEETAEERKLKWLREAKKAMKDAQKNRTIPSLLRAHAYSHYSLRPFPPPFSSNDPIKPRPLYSLAEAQDSNAMMWASFARMCCRSGVEERAEMGNAVEEFLARWLPREMLRSPSFHPAFLPPALASARSSLLSLLDFLEAHALLSPDEADRVSVVLSGGSGRGARAREAGYEEVRGLGREREERLYGAAAVGGGGGGNGNTTQEGSSSSAEAEQSVREASEGARQQQGGAEEGG